MQFQWDAANTEHIARHGVAPHEAEQVIEHDPVDMGTVLRNGEQRTLHIGETETGRVLFVVATERARKIRVVTARPARRAERKFYSNHKAGKDEESEDSGF